MRWIEITDSTTIEAVRYDAAHEVLDVRFTSDRVYRYDAVPEFVFRALLRAESKGRYFNEFIRDEYDYEEMDHRDVT
jgi:hypothetical protein